MITIAGAVVYNKGRGLAPTVTFGWDGKVSCFASTMAGIYGRIALSAIFSRRRCAGVFTVIITRANEALPKFLHFYIFTFSLFLSAYENVKNPFPKKNRVGTGALPKFLHFYIFTFSLFFVGL
jgi:hypothetical protein